MPVQVCNTKHGRMLVEQHDKYVSRALREHGEFSERQLDFFRQIVTKEMIVVDAGANIGALTIPLARMAGYVHAFEPQRHMYHLLCGNVALNDFSNVACYHAALGAEEAWIDIPTLDRSVENNLGAFSLLTQGEAFDRVQVMPLTIPCNFLKIDVEGFEGEVLKGAAEMIRECEPAIYVENDRKDKADALIAQVRAMGYTPYWHVTMLEPDENFNRSTANVFGEAASFDMICVPVGQTIDGQEAMPGDFEKLCREPAHA